MIAVSAGWNHSLAMTSIFNSFNCSLKTHSSGDHKIWIWGTTESSMEKFPVEIKSLSQVTKISACGEHNLAISEF